MPKKKSKKDGKKGKKGKKEAAAGPELYPTNPVDYLTQDFRTSMDLFATANEEIRLRAIGRLHKCIVESPDFLDQIISRKYHRKFIQLLKTENVYILRFTAAVVKLITAKPEAWATLPDDDAFALIDLTRNVFLTAEDPMLKDLTVDVLLQSLRLSSRAPSILCQKEVVSRLFDFVKNVETLDKQEKCLRIFYKLLEATSAEEILIGTPDFSIDMLLCFLQGEESHPLKPLVAKIFQKIADWENPAYLKLMCEKKTMEVATNLLLEEVQEYQWNSYEVLYQCLRLDGADIQYSKTMEFLKFLEWARKCSRVTHHLAASIITLMSRNDQLHQLLFDFQVDEIVISLLGNYQESVLPSLCETVTNLSRHMLMCYKMTNVELMTSLIDVLNNRSTSVVPYGELALKTLHRFFKCNPQTLYVVCESPALANLLEEFYRTPQMMTQDGRLAFLEIMQGIVRSKYVNKLLEISLYTTLVDFFAKFTEDAAFEKILGIVKDVMVFQEFREYFLDNNGINSVLEKLDDPASSYPVIYGLLLLVEYLIKFKKPACLFLDRGMVGRLLDLHEKLKTKTCLCEEILETLFDLCLTVKFFYTSSLGVTDKIRDQFYLMPDELVAQKKHLEVDRLTCDTPIYVVLFGSIMKYGVSKLKLPSKLGNEVKGQASGLKPKYCIDLVPSALAIRFVHQICKQELMREQGDRLFAGKHRKKRCEDERLALYICEIHQELNFGKASMAAKQGKILFVAKYVADHMGDFGLKEGERGNKRHIMNVHLLHLKDVLKSNFIPIGYLRKGLTRERALLFKVLCDQVDIPVSFNRHVSGVFWNGVTLIKSNPKSHSAEAVISVQFIVDVMGNVGELIPVSTPQAEKYFREYSKY